MKISHPFYAFEKSKVLIQHFGFFLLFTVMLVSCRKELPVTESTATDVLVNSKGQLVKTNGLPNGGFTLDAGGQGSGVNSVTGLSPLTQLYTYKTDAAGNIIVPNILIPTNKYLGDIYGQTLFVDINTYQIYPAAVLGTPVEATITWLQGSDVGKAQSLVYSGTGGISSLNDGKFAFSYSLYSSYTGSPSTQMFIPDPAYSGLTTAGGNQVTMFNQNFLENVGGGTQTVYDSAKLVFDGVGGFAFTELGWTGSAVVAPNSTQVGSAIVNGYAISSYAVIANPLVTSTGPASQVVAHSSNGTNVQVKMFSLIYSGDLNNGFHTIGTVTLYNNQVLNIDSWIYP